MKKECFKRSIDDMFEKEVYGWNTFRAVLIRNRKNEICFCENDHQSIDHWSSEFRVSHALAVLDRFPCLAALLAARLWPVVVVEEDVAALAGSELVRLRGPHGRHGDVLLLLVLFLLTRLLLLRLLLLFLAAVANLPRQTGQRLHHRTQAALGQREAATASWSVGGICKHKIVKKSKSAEGIKRLQKWPKNLKNSCLFTSLISRKTLKTFFSKKQYHKRDYKQHFQRRLTSKTPPAGARILELKILKIEFGGPCMYQED